MKENVYHPPKHRGIYLDPRTKVLFMFVLATLIFFVQENLLLNSVLVFIPILLLLLFTEAYLQLQYLQRCAPGRQNFHT